MTGPVHTSPTADVRASPSTRWPYGSAHPQTKRPSQSITRMSHGHVHWNRVDRKFSDTTYSLDNLVHVLLARQFLQIRFELVVLILHGVEKQAFGQVGAALAVVHLLDQVLNLFDQ